MGTKNIYSKNANHEGWHRNTDLAVDLKTILRSDRTMKTDKEYLGVLYALGVSNELMWALEGLVE